MNINIYGSTGIIGSKTLQIINNHFPKIKINLLCANNNVSKLIKQTFLFSPKYVYINNQDKIKILRKNINPNTKILNFNELKSYLNESKSDYSLLAISGYKALKFFDLILSNTLSLGLVNKEVIVSAGHLLNKLPNKYIKKLYPLDSEHFSVFKFYNKENYSQDLTKLTLTASGGPFLGKKYLNLKNVSFSRASKHPKWDMGYKNSIDSATMANKCLELIEAHYLFDIPFSNLDVVIHPESKVHSILEYKNYIYNMIYFHNDMAIPIFHFLNQKFNYLYKKKIYSFKKDEKLTFLNIKNDQFPIYSFFNQIDKKNPANLIKFNIGNEFAVNLFKCKKIKYTDIFKIIKKISSLNLNYNLKNIKDTIIYHEILENKINEIYKNVL